MQSKDWKGSIFEYITLLLDMVDRNNQVYIFVR